MEGVVKAGSSRSTAIRDRISWIPPFLVGLAAAQVGEMAAALLLYSAEGFLASLTVVLATEMTGLGAGFLFSLRLSPWNLDGLRYRWLLAVFSFGGAALFAGAWGLTGGFSATPLAQGLGLGLLAGLPFFSVGAVLGAMNRHGQGLPPEASASGRAKVNATAPATALGAATGVVLVGVYGMPALQPASLLLFCVVLISAAALLHGWLVDRRIRVRILDLETGDEAAPTDLRLEEWQRVTPRASLAALRSPGGIADLRVLEDGRGAALRRNSAIGLGWQRQALELAVGEEGSVLLVGVGTGALLDALLEAGRHVVAVEPARTPDLPAAWRSGGAAGESAPPLRWSDFAAQAHGGRHGVVIVNLRLLPRNGPLGGGDSEIVEAAVASRAPGGLLLIGGLPVTHAEGTEATVEWVESRCGSRPSVFRSGAGAWDESRGSWVDLLGEMGDPGGGLLVHRPGGGSKDVRGKTSPRVRP